MRECEIEVINGNVKELDGDIVKKYVCINNKYIINQSM